MADDFRDFARRLDKLEDPQTLRRIANKAGEAGKKAALAEATSSLGGDRRFSGMRRGAALNAGYDAVGASAVKLNLRPAGLWVLAEAGRRNSGGIFPRRGSRKGGVVIYGRAVMTPRGPRARSSYGKSRGLKTFSHTVDRAKREVPDAAAKQFTAEIARIVR
jgi:hypothetical protein